jgi:hypothetical protein
MERVKIQEAKMAKSKETTALYFLIRSALMAWGKVAYR